MKFFVLAAAILALSTATTLFRGGKTITVNDDGTIQITGETGKQVIITKPLGLNRNIELSVVGPNIPRKTVQIDDILTGNVGGGLGIGQGQILADILRENQGVLDEPSFGLLLQRLEQAVRNGQISSTIFNLLQDLDIPLDVLVNKLNQQDVEQQILEQQMLEQQMLEQQMLDQQIPLIRQKDVVGQRILDQQIPLIRQQGVFGQKMLDQQIPLIRQQNVFGQRMLDQQIPLIGQQGLVGQRMLGINQIPSGLVQNLLRTQQGLGVSPWINSLLSMNTMRTPMMNQWTGQRLGGIGIDTLNKQLVLQNEIGQQIPITGINQNTVPQTWLNRQQILVPGARQLVPGWRRDEIEQPVGSGINQVPQSWLIGQQMQVPDVLNRQLSGWSGVEVPQGWLPIMQKWKVNQLPLVQQLVQQQQPIMRNTLGNIEQMPVVQQQWQQGPMSRRTLNDILMGKLQQVQTLGGGFTQGLGVNQQRGLFQNLPVNVMDVPQMVLNN